MLNIKVLEKIAESLILKLEGIQWRNAAMFHNPTERLTLILLTWRIW